jgi:hypothetical protein
MAACKGWIGIAFQTQWDCQSDRIAGDPGHDARASRSRRNATRGDHVAVFDHAAFLKRRTNERQQFGKGPSGSLHGDL